MPGVAAMPGLVAIGYLVAVSSWWFVQLPRLLEWHSPAIADVSLRALEATLLLQLVVVSAFSSHWYANSREGSELTKLAESGLSVTFSVLPAWPLLMFLSLASGVSIENLAWAQVALLATGTAIVLIARGIQKFGFTVEAVRLLQASFGLVLASLAWLARHHWLEWAIL